MIRVYLIDDHPFVREGLKAFLSTRDEIEVVGESEDGLSALVDIEDKSVEVAVVDLHLPGISGIELIQRIKEINEEIQVIILSSFSKDKEVIEAIDAGALSYLMKDSPPHKLVEAIAAAKEGDPYLDANITKKLMKRVSRTLTEVEELTPREREVLSHIAKGRSNREIARELFISERTVKSHISNLFAKLGVKDRTQAAIKALEEELV